MTVREHDRSTEDLRQLLQQGLALAESHACARQTCRLGPLSCTVFANSVPLCEELTRCLAKGGSEGDLSIAILSGSRAPFALPPAWNLPHTDERHRERLHIATDGSLTATYNLDFDTWFILDHASRQALVWAADESNIPFWEQGSPFKTLINWFISPADLVMLHAGAVGAGGAGCLLIGPGGSGKSTTVAACFDRGMDVAGDDLILVEQADAAVSAWGLYDALKFDPESAVRLPPAITEAPFVPCGTKRLLRYSDLRPGGFVIRMPLRALVRCVIARRPQTAMVRETSAGLLKALAPPTIFLLRGHESRVLPKIASLVRRLPCYRLELGTDPSEAAAFLEGWLSSGAWADVPEQQLGRTASA